MSATAQVTHEKLLCSYEDVSSPSLMDCTPRHVQNLVKKGLMPQPIKIGGNVRFRRQEILDWIAAGCPAVSETSAAAAAH